MHHHPRKDNPPLEDIISASTQHLYPSGPEIPPPLPHGSPMLSHHTPPTSWFDGYRNESSSHGPSSFNHGAVRNGVLEDFSIKILCATEKIGSVIGKSGSNVKQLEKQTGARIHVEDTDSDAKERVIIVSSKEVNLLLPVILCHMCHSSTSLQYLSFCSRCDVNYSDILFSVEAFRVLQIQFLQPLRLFFNSKEKLAK